MLLLGQPKVNKVKTF